MKRVGFVATCLLVSGLASAQGPVDPSQPLPQGHPPVTASAPPGSAAPKQAPPLPEGHPTSMPAGHPPVGSSPEAAASVPAGHPPVASSPEAAASASPASDDAETSDASEAAGSRMPPGHPPASAPAPHGASTDPTEPPADRVVPAPGLPAGSVEVQLLDAQENPLAGQKVLLVQLKQSVEEGDSTEELAAVTDSAGVARFDGLLTETSFSYRAAVERGPARYATEPFRLDDTSGRRAILHSFPVVRDVRQALIGMRGIIYVSPRDDIFQIEQQFQIFNIGRVAWVPDNMRLQLPAGAKAFSAGDSMTDAAVAQAGEGSIELTGTYPPGQREVNFRFQLDNEHTSQRDLQLALPPHVAELRVITEAAPGVELRVEGFPPAQSVRGRDGKRLLVTGRQLTRGQDQLDAVRVTLAGLPVRGSGRWYALGLALFVMGFGLVHTLRQRSRPGALTGAERDLAGAKSLLLDELVLLEEVHRNGGVGPRTYEQTRTLLLDALARIELNAQHAENTATA